MPFVTGVQVPGIGDFCCTSISGVTGKLVSIGEWLDGDGFTDYDHTEIYVGMPDADSPYGYTFGAYPGGAGYRTATPDLLAKALWSTGKIPLTDIQRTEIVNSCADAKGTPYSALDYFALVAHSLDLPVPYLKKYISDSGHMICSQLVDFVYMSAGVHLFKDGRWPGYVVPADLAKLLTS